MTRRIGRTAFESAASRQLRGTTKAFSALDAFDRLFKRASEELDKPKSTPSRQAAALLCSRIADDLRAFRLLVSRGYFSQAMTIASSVLEAIWTLAYVGHSDVHASEWLAHTDLHKTPWRVAKIRAAANPSNEPLLALLYELFSAAKHHNPRLLQDLLSARSLEGHLLEVDKEYSPRAGHRVSVFSSHVLFAALDGLTSLIYLEPPLSDDWLETCTRTLVRHQSVIQYSIAAMMKLRAGP